MTHQIDEKELSYKERQGLSTSQFALPGKGSGPEGKQGGSYPIPDESHARNALARVSQHGSEAEKKTVRAAVAKKFPGIKVSEEVEIDEVGDTKAGRVDLKHYIQKRVGDVRTAKTDKKSKQHQKGIQQAAARIGFWEPKS